MIKILCRCAAPQQAPESFVGRKLRCQQCQQRVQIISGESIATNAGQDDFDSCLTVLASPDKAMAGFRLMLGGNKNIEFGKLPDRQIVLPGTLVSRAHGSLVRVGSHPSRWKIVDRKSTNGIVVNGQRISEHELSAGDNICIGEYAFEFGYGDKDSMPVAAPIEVRSDDRPEEAADPFYANPFDADPFEPIAFKDEPPAPEALVGAENEHELELVAPPPWAPAKAVVPMKVAGPPPPPARPAVLHPTLDYSGGRTCPSCDLPLHAVAKICIDCGISVPSGRPVLTSQALDEGIYQSAYGWIRWISWLVPLAPLPIPIRSAGFGTHKPYAIWTIAIATILASITFFLAQSFADRSDEGGSSLMLWAPGEKAGPLEVTPDVVHRVERHLTSEQIQELRNQLHARPNTSDDEVVQQSLAMVAQQIPHGEFHWYQLITHAFLHDTSSIYNFAMHLVGNLVFMLVFGTRVNALIGNLATALLYPVLAVAAATVHLMSLGDGPHGPMLGASGAIMGLAGIYLILFPVHRVVCAMWIRVRTIFACKVFQVRGFWVLLIYFANDVVMNFISSQFGGGSGGGVAHWAHIGGFCTGMLLGLGILFSRMFNTRGGDVLSVMLGKYAWPLIGKPSRHLAPMFSPTMTVKSDNAAPRQSVFGRFQAIFRTFLPSRPL